MPLIIPGDPVNTNPDRTETERLHAEILEGKAKISELRDLLRSENQRANSAIERETTAEQAAIEAQQDAHRLRAVVARVRRLHDALDAETDLTSPDDEITRGAAARKIAAALDGWSPPAADIEAHRLALSAVLGLGTGAPWDAIHDRTRELAEAGDRAAVLREAAGRYEEILAKADTGQDPRYWTAVRDITLGLRAMAAEAQQPEGPAPVDPAERPELYAVAIHDAMEPDLSLVDQEPGQQALFARAAEAVVALADSEQATLRRKLADAEKLRENADFHLGQEMARRQLAEKEAARLSADRDAVLNAAARHLYTALFPAVYDDMGQKAAEGVQRAVSELRRLAAEARPARTDRAADGQGEPAELRDLPREVRHLVHAVDRMRSDWAESSPEHQAELWRQVHEASDAVWNRPLAAEAPTTTKPETEAHPPHHRWMVETRDDLAEEWAPGMRFTDRAEAVARYQTVSELYPEWRDGTPVQRRFVRETTPYTVEAPE